MTTAFVCETDIFIEPGNTPIFLDSGVIEVLGYKDPTTAAVDGPYGGLSNNTIKTGGTPSEAKIFLLDVVTGARPDAEEGIRLILVDDAGVEIIPFEEVYFKTGTTNGDKEYKLEAVGTRYRCLNGTDNVEIERYFRQNINNTPAVELKCYPTAP